MIDGMANAEGYGNDVALLNALRSGVMIEGHQGTWDQLTNEERNDAMKLVMERIKAVNDQEDQMQKQYRRVLERRRGQIQRDVRDRGELMPQSEIDMLVGEMQDANIITDGEDIFSQQFIDIVKNRTFMNDIATDEQIAVFRQGVRDGDITPEVTDSLMRQGWLGGKQKAELDDLYSVVSKFDTRNNIKVIQRKIDGLDIPQYHKKVLKDKAIARFTDLLMGDPEGVVTQDVHAQAAMDFATKGFNENQIKEGKRQLTEQYAESLAKGYIDPEFASMDSNLLLENLMSGVIDPNMIFLNPDERRIKDRINALMRIVNQIKDYQ